MLILSLFNLIHFNLKKENILKNKFSILIFSSCTLLGLTSNMYAYATTYFEWKGSDGYKYLGAQNPHPGGGYFAHLGGKITKPEGNGCDAPTDYHNTVVSNDVAAQGASLNSTYSLKTPYRGDCPNESFTRDTTIINTPLLSEYYIRWNQKWTGSFQASVQQKFAKFYNASDTSEKTITAYLSLRPNNPGGATPGVKVGRFENFMPNIDGHFDKIGCTQYVGNVWVTPVAKSMDDCYNGQNRGFDDSDVTTSAITFELDRWYTIEIHSKLNTNETTSDAVYEIWIDGILRLSVSGFKFRDGDIYNSPGTNNFEFQHVYYNRSNFDQSTYMDNIVISDHYNGPVGSKIPKPAKPTAFKQLSK